jgi:signal transduction histidine kinase
VDVQSKVGEGSTFIVELPRNELPHKLPSDKRL